MMGHCNKKRASLEASVWKSKNRERQKYEPHGSGGTGEKGEKSTENPYVGF
jgi:hypothetical protein